jgi:Mlc titration factor MtfA (ptsG expression regulator)
LSIVERWRAWRDNRAVVRHAIPEPLWRRTLDDHPFLARRSAADLLRLRRLCSLFLARKEFTGAHGLQVDDAMALAIAAQACLPVLELGLAAYDGFVGIVVQPDEVLVERETVDEDGVVHQYGEALVGEAMAGGPVMLSWHDVAQAGADAALAFNLVIHEFAHVLDMGDGQANGMPPLADAAARRQWAQVMEAEFERFCDLVDAGHDTLLDPYGAEAPEEFFAVASEAFFVAPPELRDAHPALYALLAGYYRQDPAGTD